MRGEGSRVTTQRREASRSRGVPSRLECRCGVWFRLEDGFSTTTGCLAPGVELGWGVQLVLAQWEGGPKEQWARELVFQALRGLCLWARTEEGRIWRGAFGTPEKLIHLFFSPFLTFNKACTPRPRNNLAAWGAGGGGQEETQEG